MVLPESSTNLLAVSGTLRYQPTRCLVLTRAVSAVPAYALPGTDAACAPTRVLCSARITCEQVWAARVRDPRARGRSGAARRRVWRLSCCCLWWLCCYLCKQGAATYGSRVLLFLEAACCCLCRQPAAVRGGNAAIPGARLPLSLEAMLPFMGTLQLFMETLQPFMETLQLFMEVPQPFTEAVLTGLGDWAADVGADARGPPRPHGVHGAIGAPESNAIARVCTRKAAKAVDVARYYWAGTERRATEAGTARGRPVLSGSVWGTRAGTMGSGKSSQDYSIAKVSSSRSSMAYAIGLRAPYKRRLRLGAVYYQAGKYERRRWYGV
eukprot:2408141-Rhodomonas_salina.3